MNTIAQIRRLSSGRMLLIAGIAATLPFAAQAGEPGNAQTIDMGVVVSYADLNLAQEAGAQTLYARLKRAADKVCGHRPSPLELRATNEYRECYDTALNKAVERVGNQQLFALHGKRGRQATMG